MIDSERIAQCKEGGSMSASLSISRFLLGRLSITAKCHICAGNISTRTISGATKERFMENRVALVTGSTSGIGLCIARNLASRGCSVILNGFGDESTITSLKEEFATKYNGRADYIYADLSKTEEVDRFCRDIKSIHPDGVDIIVNNAGLQYVSPIEDFPIETANSMLSLMLGAPLHIIKHLISDMKRKGWGRIINVSSSHGHVASPNKSAYVAAKHGIIGLTKVVALEAAGTGVTANAVCPGYVNTNILQGQVRTLAEKDGISYPEAEMKFLSNFHATKTAVEVDHLAEAIVFMCSDAASQMTGTSMIIDGGWTAK